MAIITTYVCDASGKTGVAEDFVKVNVQANKITYQSPFDCNKLEKVIHKDVAAKLGLIQGKAIPVEPELTLESKLMALLKQYIDEVAYEAGSEAASNNNRGG